MVDNSAWISYSPLFLEVNMLHILRQLRKVQRVLFVDEPIGPHPEAIRTALRGEPIPLGKTVMVVSATAIERYVFGRETTRHSEWFRAPYTSLLDVPRTFFRAV